MSNQNKVKNQVLSIMRKAMAHSDHAIALECGTYKYSDATEKAIDIASSRASANACNYIAENLIHEFKLDREQVKREFFQWLGYEYSLFS